MEIAFQVRCPNVCCQQKQAKEKERGNQGLKHVRIIAFNVRAT